MLFLSSALAATGSFSWEAGVARLRIDSPGEHVSAEAPTTLRAGAVTVDLRGDPSPVRVPVADGALDVELSLALCTDGSTRCRFVTLAGSGTVAGRKGSFALAERSGPTPGFSVPATPAPPASPPPAGVRVLDFTAVWCPPCNLLAVEVLHDPVATAGIPIETIDVDQPASWQLKDRYAVGGYPTLVAVDAQGNEIDRVVGYSGLPDMKAWFAGLSRQTPLDALIASLPTLSGAEASRAARRLAEIDRADEARSLFPRAEDGVDLRIARLLTDPTEADATWLFEHAPPDDWVFAALEASPSRWSTVVAFAGRVPPIQGADFLGVAAEKAPADVQASLRSAALAVLRAALTGDPAHDRPHVTYQAELMAETGDLAGALALLDRYAGIYPKEFTFLHAAARQLVDAGRNPEAEAKARAALAVAWGDQRLRATEVLAKALVAQGRNPEALTAIDAALAEVPEPPSGVEVRTSRYRKNLGTLRATVSAKK